MDCCLIIFLTCAITHFREKEAEAESDWGYVPKAAYEAHGARGPKATQTKELVDLEFLSWLCGLRDQVFWVGCCL